MFTLNLPDHLAEQLGDNPERAFAEMLAIWRELRSVHAMVSRETYQRRAMTLDRSQLISEIVRFQAVSQCSSSGLHHLEQKVDELESELIEARAENIFLSRQVESINEECQQVMADLENCIEKSRTSVELFPVGEVGAAVRIELFPIAD